MRPGRTIARDARTGGRVGSDGGERGLAIGGPPEAVAEYFDGYRRNGIGEVILVFRSPVRPRDDRADRRVRDELPDR